MVDPKHHEKDALIAMERLAIEDGSLEWYMTNELKLGALVYRASPTGGGKGHLKMFLESLRYFPQSRVPLDCPIVAFGATDDEIVPLQKILAWGSWTTRYFTVVPLTQGGHKFIITNYDSVAEFLCKLICGSFF